MIKHLIFYWYIPDYFWYDVYNLHINNLQRYASLFDRVTVVLAINDTSDLKKITRMKMLMNGIFPVNIDYIIYQNDSELRESNYFYNEVYKKLNWFEDECVFFAHNKGAFTDYCSKQYLDEWIDTMYDGNLKQANIENFINNQDAFCGGVRIRDNCQAFEWQKYKWHFQGAFFWIKPKAVGSFINENNIVIPENNRYFTEGFLGCIFSVSSKHVFQMEKIIISDICGGLGNAMFMYIVGKSVAQKYGCEFKYYISEPRENFLKNWYPKFWFLKPEEQITKLQEGRVIVKESENFNIYDRFNELLQLIKRENVILKGYWQHDGWFNKDLCSDIFKICEADKMSIIGKYGDFSERVHICVRKGDYVSLGIDLPFSWYDNAIKHYFPHRKLVITSDDIDWCKHHFNEYDVKYIDNSDFIEQMWAGTLCKDHVIADSSFGWWQAYLSDANKVVCPTGWSAAVDGWITEDK